MARVITGIVAALGWAGYIIVTNPGLIHFGDLHDWHGRNEPELVALVFNTVAAVGFSTAMALIFGGPRWMIWPCAGLSLLVVVLWAAPAVPGSIRELHYWYYEREAVYGRLQYLWATLASAFALDVSLLSWAVLGVCSWRRKRPNQAMLRIRRKVER
jgi:hypothetical protein